MLASQATLLRRLRAAYGSPEPEFEQHLLAPIIALAAWLHLLPGPPGGGFDRRGGAIEQALTNCLFCLQAADGRTFDPGSAADSTLSGTQRWRLACALGGLFAALSELLSRIEVATSDGLFWPAPAMPLLRWLESVQASSYRYRWTEGRAESNSSALYAASRCIDPSVMACLVGPDARAAVALMNCVAGPNRSRRDSVADVVDTIAAAVAARDRPAGVAAPADNIVSTLMRLLGTSDWLPNAPGGHVWHGTDGFFLLWPEAAVKLVDAMPHGLSDGKRPTHDHLLEHLLRSGVVQSLPAPVLSIRPPGHSRPSSAVRLDPHHFPPSVRGHAPLEVPLWAAERGRHPAVQVGAAQAAESASCEGVGADGPGGDPEKELHPLESDTPPAGGVTASVDFEQDAPRDARLTPGLATIANPRIRDAVAGVVARLDQSFDTMLARVVPGGVFVALTEFVGPQGDGAAIVRALADAGLLASDTARTAKRVVTETVAGSDAAGVVLAAESLHGSREWAARWAADDERPRCGLHSTLPRPILGKPSTVPTPSASTSASSNSASRRLN